MLKKKKEKKNYEYFDESKLLEYDRVLLINKLQSLYPVGTIVDQTTAYSGNGNTKSKIDGNYITFHDNDGGFTNVSIGNTGIWHSRYKSNSTFWRWKNGMFYFFWIGF